LHWTYQSSCFSVIDYRGCWEPTCGCSSFWGELASGAVFCMSISMTLFYSFYLYVITIITTHNRKSQLPRNCKVLALVPPPTGSTVIYWLSNWGNSEQFLAEWKGRPDGENGAGMGIDRDEKYEWITINSVKGLTYYISSCIRRWFWITALARSYL
jgi:hypothetical protein